MPYFQLTLSGDGISVPIEGEADPIIGFFTTRVVTAADPTIAAALAMSLVSREWSHGKYAQQNRGGMPSLSVTASSKIGFFKGTFGRRPAGYVFFRYND